MVSLRKQIQISPSMMCANPLVLSEVLKTLETGKVEWLHIDIMDGHYVPNLTLGPDYCRSLARATTIPQDIHLMVENPERLMGLFEGIEGSRISFHPETVRQPVRLIERIREMGATAGIAVDPSLSIESLMHLLPLVDQVIVMTVNPGYAGQKLIPFCLSKISHLRDLLNEVGSEASIEVDGNVSWENIPKMVDAGADILVAGTSSLFVDGTVPMEAIERMRLMVRT